MKSIKTKFFLEKCLAGLNFIAIGLTYSIKQMPIPLGILLGMIVIMYCVFQLGMKNKIPFEPEDEMTILHEQRAQAAIYNGICIILAVLGLLCLFRQSFSKLLFSFALQWPYLFFVLGILQIVEFFIFIMIERQGDPIE